MKKRRGKTKVQDTNRMRKRVMRKKGVKSCRKKLGNCEKKR